MPLNASPYLIFSSITHDTMRKKCYNLEFFWPAFSRNQTEYRDLKSKKIYKVSLRIQSKCEKLQTRKTPIQHFLESGNF